MTSKDDGEDYSTIGSSSKDIRTTDILYLEC